MECVSKSSVLASPTAALFRIPSLSRSLRLLDVARNDVQQMDFVGLPGKPEGIGALGRRPHRECGPAVRGDVAEGSPWSFRLPTGRFPSRVARIRSRSSRSTGLRHGPPFASVQNSNRSVKETIERIQTFTENYIQTSMPLEWTAKTASILHKIERLCKAISGT